MEEGAYKPIQELQEAVNCVRKTVIKAQTEATANLTDFKSDQTEKFMTFKYEQSEALTASSYQLRHELSDMLEQTKKEYIEAAKTDRLWVTDQLLGLRELLETKIISKMKATLITSGVIFAMLTILSTMMINTRTLVDTTEEKMRQDTSIFKEQIRKQLSDFKQEMREEFGTQLNQIKENQVKMTTLLMIHLDKKDDLR